VKNVRGKTQPQQRKMSSKAIKGKQPLQQTTVMMQANLKFVMGRPILTADELHKAGQPCIDLHNYYIQNYKLGKCKCIYFTLLSTLMIKYAYSTFANIYIRLILSWQDYENAFINTQGSSLEHIKESLA
jgi:hypothetical protein